MTALVIIQTFGLVLTWLSTNWSLLWEQSLCEKALIKQLCCFFLNNKPAFGCYSRLLTFMFQPKSKFKNITFWNFVFFLPLTNIQIPFPQLWTQRCFLLISGAVDTLQTLNMQGFFYPRDLQRWTNLSIWLLQILSEFAFIYRQKNWNFTLAIGYCSAFDLCMFLKWI